LVGQALEELGDIGPGKVGLAQVGLDIGVDADHLQNHRPGRRVALTVVFSVGPRAAIASFQRVSARPVSRIADALPGQARPSIVGPTACGPRLGLRKQTLMPVGGEKHHVALRVTFLCLSPCEGNAQAPRPDFLLGGSSK